MILKKVIKNLSSTLRQSGAYRCAEKHTTINRRCTNKSVLYINSHNKPLPRLGNVKSPVKKLNRACKLITAIPRFASRARIARRRRIVRGKIVVRIYPVDSPASGGKPRRVYFLPQLLRLEWGRGETFNK